MKTFTQIMAAAAVALATPGTGVAKGASPDRLAFEVRVQSLGAFRLELAGREIATGGFRVLSETEGGEMKVFNDGATGHWVSLETMLEGGQTIRYVPAMGLVASTGGVAGRSGGSR